MSAKDVVQFFRQEQEFLKEEATSRSIGTYKTEARKATIKLEDGSLVKGKINLLTELARDENTFDKFAKDGGAFYTRISDLFTRGKNPFIVVFDAIVEGRDGRVLVINKNKILWVSPED